MFNKNLIKITSLLFVYMFIKNTSLVNAQTKIVINAGQDGAPISKTMYGIFFEDINFGADGGLYAELVKNRSFEFPENLMGWSKLQREGAEGTLAVQDEEPFMAGKTYGESGNLHYLHIDMSESGEGFGITNEGFRGIGIQEGKKYYFSIFARSKTGNMSLKVELVTSDGRIVVEGSINKINQSWARHIISMTAQKTESKTKLNLIVTQKGVLDVDMVSLFPEDSAVSDPYSSNPIPGLRKDLVKILADMKPGFVRFPGGCIVEGYDLSLRYQWKNTIGAISQRKLIKNRWNTEVRNRIAPDYYQSYGLGYYEFFLLAEQLGAEPMPIQNCGMACQFNSGELVPMDELQPYVQDALDLIEFANGPVGSKWGKVRAEMGHPEPFNMKMIGVGNEQWRPQYVERYKVFAKAIKEKYPDMQLIAATGSEPTYFRNGHAEVAYLWEQWRILKPEIVDEHFYQSPDWFLSNTARYDEFDRNGPKVFAGEYAAHSPQRDRDRRKNDLQSALAETSMMTGFERNADVVRMTSYAPLLAHVDAWQWSPNLIWFDNLNVYGTANYYVQKLFSLNSGTNILTVNTSGIQNSDRNQKALNVSSTLDKEANEVIIKAVNITNEPIKANIELQGVSKITLQAKQIILSASSLNDENTLQKPQNIYPVEKTITLNSTDFSYEFKPNSLIVLRIPVEK